MKVGDMVLSENGQTAILLTKPRVADDDMGWNSFYVAEVFLTEFGYKEVWITDDLEIVNANW